MFQRFFQYIPACSSRLKLPLPPAHPRTGGDLNMLIRQPSWNLVCPEAKEIPACAGMSGILGDEWIFILKRILGFSHLIRPNKQFLTSTI